LKILIVEDEPLIADHIQWMCECIIGREMQSCNVIHSLENALHYLHEHPIDLLLLDLNLEGENGFDILKQSVSGAFHTIIISAFTDQAITAFQHGVLDFIPKPFEEERLCKAFDRYFNLMEKRQLETKFLAVRENNDVFLLKIDDILYFKAAGNYIEAHLKNGGIKLIIKAMNKLEQILPARFMRIHKSYIADVHQITSYKHTGGGVYQVELSGSRILPLSRSKYKEFKERVTA